jgi:glycosyltransferase involved in cell wall biosynthesis
VAAIVQDLVGAGAVETEATSGWIARAISRIELAALRRCALVGSIGPTFRQAFTDGGIDSDKILDVPNFSHVRMVDCTKAEARTRLGWPVSGFFAIHTGNMGAKQDLGTAVDAARVLLHEMPEFRLVIVGDGNTRETIERSARDLQNVVLVPPLSEELYPYALKAADVLLLLERSGVREMSLPSKITSYVTAGRPIVAAVTEGGATYKEFTTHGLGTVVRASTPSELVAALHRQRSSLNADSSELEAQSTYAQRLGKESASERYISLADELTKSPRDQLK